MTIITSLKKWERAVLAAFLTGLMLLTLAPAAFADGLTTADHVKGDGVYSYKISYTTASYTANGKKVKNKLVTLYDKDGTYKFYFDKKGRAVHGKTKYYDGDRYVTRWLKLQKVGKYTYAFDEKGHAVTGVQVVMKNSRKQNWQICFFNKNGRLNVKKSRTLQKSVKQFAKLSKALAALKKRGTVPVSGPTSQGEECIGRGYTTGYDLFFQNFVIRVVSNTSGSKVSVYSLAGIAN